MTWLAALLCLLILASSPSPAVAADSEQDERIELWNSLTSSEREELRRRYRQLQGAPPEQREELRRRLQRFRNLPAEKRQQMRQSYRQWKELTPERRARLRQNFRRWRELSPGQRRELTDQYRRWQRLPAEKRLRIKQFLGDERGRPRDPRPGRRPDSSR